MSTLILPAPTGDLPDETQTLDVNALRKSTIRRLLDLADEHNLSFRDFNFNGDSGGQWLHIWLDADQADAQAAWAEVLGLVASKDLGIRGAADCWIYRRSSADDVLGLVWIEVSTFLYPARGLPEQGPRPDVARAELAQAAALAADAAQVLATLAEPVAVATAALTPDDPSLPVEVLPETCDDCESTGYNCSLHADFWMVDEAEAAEPVADPNAATDAEDYRTAIQAKLEAHDLADAATVHVVDGAEAGVFWVVVRTADDMELLAWSTFRNAWYAWYSDGTPFDRLAGDADATEVVAVVAEMLAALASTAPRTYSAGQIIDADVRQVRDHEGAVAERRGDLWVYDWMNDGSPDESATFEEAELLSEYGPVTEIHGGAS